MFWPFKRKRGDEDAIWKEWDPELPPAKDLSDRVWMRIDREYREACNQSELDALLSNTFDKKPRFQEAKGISALWQNIYVQAGFAAACVVLGVLLAEWRLAQYWRAHSQALADKYVRLLTPELGDAAEGTTVTKKSETPEPNAVEEGRP